MKLPLPHFSLGKRLSPHRDWIILIVITFVALVLSIAWNLWLFNQVASGAVLGDASHEETAPLSEKTLEELDSLFTKRAETRRGYAEGAERFVDPSKE